MKKLVKTLSALSLCVLLMLTSCSKTRDVIYCADDSGKVVSAMNENMFSYSISEKKTETLAALGANADSADLWNMPSAQDGKTVGDMMLQSIVNSGKVMVASGYMFEDTKKASDSARDVLEKAELEIEKNVDNLIEQLTRSVGSKSKLESYLAQFGTNIKNLRAYYTLYFKQAALIGSFVPTEEEKKEYFAENYSIVKHILINTSFKVKDDGSRVSLSEAEIAAQLARADALNIRLAAGEDFDELWALPEYQDADAAGAAKYPEGYFVCEGSNFTPEFEKAALEMKPGEIRTVKSTYGVHIMKKYPMDAEKYNLYADIYSSLETAVGDLLFDEAVKPYVEKVTVNEDVVAEFSVATAAIMTQ